MSVEQGGARSFVVIEDGERAFGFAAERVARVVPEEEWTGDAPRALSPVGDAPDDTLQRRVLVAKTKEGERAVLGCGRVDVIAVAGDDVLPLPPFFTTAERPSLISHVVFREGAAPLLVVDVDAFAEAP